MLLITILNKQYNFKSFIYKKSILDNRNKRLIVKIVPGKNGIAKCSCCGSRASIYDTRKERKFEFIPFWGLKVFFLYTMRRVNCSKCGVKIEKVPWGTGKQTLTEAFALYLADWAKSLSWKETAQRFKVSWQKVFNAVEYVVNWGLAHRDLSNITAIGIDEISYRIGHRYLTLVYQINVGALRLLWAGKDRSVKTILKFFKDFGQERTKKLEYVCSDMWKPYLKVIKKKAGQAIHVLDRFHIIQKINKAIDEVRANEARKLVAEGKAPVLKKSRW